MRVNDIRPVLLQRRPSTLLLPFPLQTDGHGERLQLLLQHVQLSSLLLSQGVKEEGRGSTVWGLSDDLLTNYFWSAGLKKKQKKCCFSDRRGRRSPEQVCICFQTCQHKMWRVVRRVHTSEAMLLSDTPWLNRTWSADLGLVPADVPLLTVAKSVTTFCLVRRWRIRQRQRREWWATQQQATSIFNIFDLPVT